MNLHLAKIELFALPIRKKSFLKKIKKDTKISY